MTLAAGTRLGPYESLAPLGAGGMGAVDRARDTRLERTVAVKVLAEHRSATPVARQRFEREARTISQLSHPHICALYDVGREGESAYLVMELLDGETLADRLLRGALPPGEILRHGIEIADALDKAHRQGVVHRDLKPGNVMLTRSGVKLLDFGLAKAMAPMAPQSSLTALPTVAGAPSLTQEGMVLGTLPYMAPEQLEGKESDARTDIWALGAVLYEMATGQRPFTGGSQASLTGAILKDQVPLIGAMQPTAPPALDRVVQRALAKDPENRWQSARDLTLELRAIEQAPPDAERRQAGGSRLARVVAVVATVASLLLGAAWLSRPHSAPVSLRLSVLPPEHTTFTPVTMTGAPRFDLSPDGKRLAFVASTSGGRPLLWVRSLDSFTAQSLPGTEDAAGPFWSPDGGAIGFFAGGKLKTIDLPGGVPRVLADTPAHRGGTWSQSGVILFGSSDVLYSVSAAGGAVATVTALDTAHGETSHRFPQFLPDGRHFLYLARAPNRNDSVIYCGSLDSRERTRLLQNPFRTVYAAPGYLVFARSGSLMAQKFDPSSLKLSGEPFSVTEDVGALPGHGFVPVAFSKQGTLAYWRLALLRRQLAWFDRSGRPLGAVGPEGNFEQPSLSPDGRRVVLQRRDLLTNIGEVLLLDLSTEALSRFTFGDSFVPVWSPDGSRIAFGSKGQSDLVQKSVSGGAEEMIFKSGGQGLIQPSDWSRDGRFIVFHTLGPKTTWDIWVFRASDRTATPFLQTTANEVQGRLSPDSRWMAYTSNETGSFEVYVQSFPAGGGKWQVSNGGGSEPHWRADGTELFYIAADKKMMAVPVQIVPTFAPGAPKALFETQAQAVLEPYWSNYDVTADGQRFLVSTVSDEIAASPISIVTNWTNAKK